MGTQERRRNSKFMKLAHFAVHEALDDASWRPRTVLEEEMTVRHVGIVGNSILSFTREYASDRGLVASKRYMKPRWGSHPGYVLPCFS